MCKTRRDKTPRSHCGYPADEGYTTRVRRQILRMPWPEVMQATWVMILILLSLKTAAMGAALIPQTVPSAIGSEVLVVIYLGPRRHRDLLVAANQARRFQ